jgi:hypothetical protein
MVELKAVLKVQELALQLVDLMVAYLDDKLVYLKVETKEKSTGKQLVELLVYYWVEQKALLLGKRLET